MEPKRKYCKNKVVENKKGGSEKEVTETKICGENKVVEPKRKYCKNKLVENKKRWKRKRGC